MVSAWWRSNEFIVVGSTQEERLVVENVSGRLIRCEGRRGLLKVR